MSYPTRLTLLTGAIFLSTSISFLGAMETGNLRSTPVTEETLEAMETRNPDTEATEENEGVTAPVTQKQFDALATVVGELAIEVAELKAKLGQSTAPSTRLSLKQKISACYARLATCIPNMQSVKNGARRLGTGLGYVWQTRHVAELMLLPAVKDCAYALCANTAATATVVGNTTPAITIANSTIATPVILDTCNQAFARNFLVTNMLPYLEMIAASLPAIITDHASEAALVIIAADLVWMTYKMYKAMPSLRKTQTAE